MSGKPSGMKAKLEITHSTAQQHKTLTNKWSNNKQ